MRMVNVHEAKTTLSKILEEVERGETVIIARNGEPVAELRSVKKPNLAESVEKLRSEIGLRTAGISIRELIEEGRH